MYSCSQKGPNWGVNAKEFYLILYSIADGLFAFNHQNVKCKLLKCIYKGIMFGFSQGLFYTLCGSFLSSNNNYIPFLHKTYFEILISSCTPTFKTPRIPTLLLFQNSKFSSDIENMWTVSVYKLNMYLL